MGKVKLGTGEYNAYIRRIENQCHEIDELESEIDRLNFARDKIVELIDAEADRVMETNDTWSEPMFIKIADIAELIDLDWNDYLTNWKKLRKEKSNEK